YNVLFDTFYFSFVFFFLKKKTAYDFSACCVGSESYIRDRSRIGSVQSYAFIDMMHESCKECVGAQAL
ncbi:hypothetical protein JT096_08530, partial [Helicobacter pylori]|nr:hypothetical protein [Helicobacter pylori]